MKLDLKTLFVALSILVSYQCINSNKDSELVTVFIEPSINVVTLSYYGFAYVKTKQALY